MSKTNIRGVRFFLFLYQPRGGWKPRVMLSYVVFTRSERKFMKGVRRQGESSKKEVGANALIKGSRHALRGFI